jgi:hypothetical protein
MKYAKIAIALSASLICTAPNAAIADTAQNAQRIQVAVNPWNEFDQLSKTEQVELINYYKTAGYPTVFNDTLFTLNSSYKQSRSYPSLSTFLDNVPELLDCIALTNLNMCTTAKNDASTAEASAQARFPATTLHNGKGDAYRHCYWSGLMTRHIGSGNALKISENHETHSPGPLIEYQMDTYNNTKGRVAGINSAYDSDVRYTCYAWANNGTLITLF